MAKVIRHEKIVIKAPASQISMECLDANGSDIPMRFNSDHYIDGATSCYYFVNAEAGTSRGFAIQTSNSTRWIIKANSTAESGSDVGSDLSIGRYTDAGALISNTLVIKRENGHIEPGANGANNLGSSSKKFKDIYATNGTIQTSDAREKEEVETCDLGLAFAMKLRPVSFRWKSIINEPTEEEKKQGAVTTEIQHVRRHYGLIAQELDAALEGKDFAGLIYNEEADRYGIRYTELVPVLLKAIQELTARVEALEAK
jgi:hypothetical protein